MNESINATTNFSETINGRRTLLITAWAMVLLLTVPQIILGGFMGHDTAWLSPARIVILAAFFALTFIWPPVHSLRRMTLVFLVIYAAEEWFFLTLIQHSPFYQNLFGGDPNLVFFGSRLLRIGASLVMLLMLLGMGLKRQDFFLTLGNLKAVAEAERWGVPRKPETWPGFSLRYAVIIAVIFLIFMIPSMQPSLNNLSVGLALFAALCAFLNAFAEEFLYRSALLPQVLPLFGKGASMILVASWFGIGHYFGVPSGSAGVILVTIGGWIFAKSMIETQGMGWPLFMHFVSDFTVYMIILLAGGF